MTTADAIRKLLADRKLARESLPTPTPQEAADRAKLIRELNAAARVMRTSR